MDKCIYMFATNDKTLKIIIVESIYTMSIPNIVFETFSTKKQTQVINNIIDQKLGKNRTEPFLTRDKFEINKLLQPLLKDVTLELQNSIVYSNNQ